MDDEVGAVVGVTVSTIVATDSKPLPLM